MYQVSFDWIFGFVIGTEYIEDTEDGYFALVIHLGLFRILLIKPMDDEAYRLASSFLNEDQEVPNQKPVIPVSNPETMEVTTISLISSLHPSPKTTELTTM